MFWWCAARLPVTLKELMKWAAEAQAVINKQAQDQAS